ncbi:unnamed protein product [Lymnaea stagnalis]|uniref:CUB domain-containing protein n=1 Tax=Lymnaea stagnalis TaxID=6523 RepID=A0AAV2HIS4_LYMST
MKFVTPAVVLVFSPLLLTLLPGDVVAFSDCGGILNEKKGTVRSPGYPLNYPNDAACNWTIIAAVNEIIDMRFSMIDLDGNSFSCPDIVTVFDGDNWQATPIMRFCTLLNKTELDSLSIRSTGNKMYITFTSDYSNTRKGFISQFTAQGRIYFD